MPRPKKSVVESAVRKLGDRILEYVTRLCDGAQTGLQIKAAWPSFSDSDVNAALVDLSNRKLMSYDSKSKLYRVCKDVLEAKASLDALDAKDAAKKTNGASKNLAVTVEAVRKGILDYCATRALADDDAPPPQFTTKDILEEVADLPDVVNKALQELATEGRLSSQPAGKGKDRFTLYTLVPFVSEAAADQPDEDPDDDIPFDDDEDTDEGDDREDEPGEDSAADGPLFVASHGTNGTSNGHAAQPEFTPTRYLKHDFTLHELTEFREERESIDVVIENLQAELETAQERVKSLKKRIETRQEDGMALSKKIRFGSEMRSVPCEERREIDQRFALATTGTMIMVTYRLDTDEAVDWRKLTLDERQGKLWDEAPAASPANGALEVREAAPVGPAADAPFSVDSAFEQAGLAPVEAAPAVDPAADLFG